LTNIVGSNQFSIESSSLLCTVPSSVNTGRQTSSGFEVDVFNPFGQSGKCTITVTQQPTSLLGGSQLTHGIFLT
jgi:hypothetical protein